MEIGPGDSLFSALIAYTLGVKSSYLIDSGFFAKRNIESYLTMAEFLNKKSLSVPNITKVNSLEEILTTCNSHYYTDGLASLRTIPDKSVDFIFSQAVLEHIRREEFEDFMLELHRVITPQGMCSHRIDLKDHLNSALNNLRFSERVWESNFMTKSGFYTNRLRYSELLDIFHRTGFTTEIVEINTWATLPTPKNKLAIPYQQMTDEELKVSGFDVILRPI